MKYFIIIKQDYIKIGKDARGKISFEEAKQLTSGMIFIKNVARFRLVPEFTTDYAGYIATTPEFYENNLKDIIELINNNNLRVRFLCRPFKKENLKLIEIFESI